MDEATTSQRTLVFIGTPRAGKTCLMAAWYQFLDNHPSIGVEKVRRTPDGEVRDILDIWKRIRDEGIAPSPTEVGKSRKYQVDFAYRDRSVSFTFVDYAGETVTRAFSGELKDPKAQDEVIRTCKDADKLFLVINLEDFLHQNRNPLSDVLGFLDQVSNRQEFKVLFEHGVTVYLSHPEKLSKEKRRECLREITSRFRAAIPAFTRDSIVLGTAVTERDEKHVAFTDSNHPFSPDRHFHHVLADLVKEDDASSDGGLGKLIDWVFLSRRGRVAMVFILAVGLAGWWGVEQLREQRAESGWQDHRRGFAEIQENALSDALAAGQSLKDLQHWEATANSDFRERFLRDEYDQKAQDLRQSLEEKRGQGGDISKMREQIASILRQHGTNYRRIYPEIIRQAESALANPEDWVLDARTEWRTIRDFVRHLQAGVLLELVEPSFWTSGNDTLQVELQIYRRGDSVPYGTETTSVENLKGIQLPFISEPIKGRNQFRYVWGGEHRSTHPFQPELDRVDLRIVKQYRRWYGRLTTEEVTRLEVPLSAIHGLGWMDGERKFSEGKTDFVANFSRFRLLDRSGNLLEVPKLLSEESR